MFLLMLRLLSLLLFVCISLSLLYFGCVFGWNTLYHKIYFVANSIDLSQNSDFAHKTKQCNILHEVDCEYDEGEAFRLQAPVYGFSRSRMDSFLRRFSEISFVYECNDNFY